MTVHKTDAFNAWVQSHPDVRAELINGEIRTTSPAGEQHGDIASELNMLIRAYAKKHSLGRVTAAETGYIVDETGTVLAPDVGFTPHPPDLAVEVVSPHDSAGDVQQKVALYLQHDTLADDTLLQGFSVRVGDVFGT